MGKFNHISNNFKMGEFSPKMRARTELDEYRSSVERLLNIIPSKQGAANKRTGSKYVSTISPSSNDVRTIPFIFSKTEAYVVTLDPLGLAASTLTDLDFFHDPLDDTRYHSIDPSDLLSIVRNDGTASTVEGELGHVYDSRAADMVGEDMWDPFPPEILNIIGIDPKGFQYAQSGDILVLTHISGDIPPLVIARTSLDTFEVEWLYRFNLRAFDPTGITSKYYAKVLRNPLDRSNITPLRISGNFVQTDRYIDPDGFYEIDLYDVFLLTAEGLGAGDFFSDSKLGQTITVQVLDTSPTGDDPPLQDIDFTIVAIVGTSPSNVARVITTRYASVGLDFTTGRSAPYTTAQSFPATDNWRESSWGGDRGHPRTVCFFEQRLILGGSKKDVDTIWASQTGDIFKFLGDKYVQDTASDYTNLKNFIPTNIPEKDQVVDIFGNVQLQTDPLSFKPSSQEINSIQWLSSGQSLMVGTLGAEYVVSGSDGALSATSINYRRQTSRGGSPVMPVRIDDEVFYILRDGRSAHNFKYNRNNGSFLSSDITLHADHIVDVGNEATVSQFTQVEYCTSRDLVLAITDDNFLLGFTYSPQQNTMAWHRYDFDADILSVCSVPSENGDIDEIWICALRNGVRTLEKIGSDFKGSSINDPNNPSLFLDSYISRTNLAAPETIDMSHLEDKTVKVYVDGYFSFEQLLDSGNTDVELPICTTAIIGLPYTALIETNDLKVGGDFGSPVGNVQRIDRVTGIFYKSMRVKCGKTEGAYLDPIPNMSELTDGNKNIDFPSSSSEDGARVTIVSEDAFPMTVLGLVARGITSDR